MEKTRTVMELFATPAAYEMMMNSTKDYSPGTIYTTTKQGFTLSAYYAGGCGVETVKTGWGNILVKTTKEKDIPDSVVKFGEIVEDENGERGRNCPAENIDCYGSLAVI